MKVIGDIADKDCKKDCNHRCEHESPNDICSKQEGFCGAKGMRCKCVPVDNSPFSDVT
jgi:hypothetical protein